MSMCSVFSYVVGRRCLLWPVLSLGKTLWASALLHLLGTPGVSWIPTFVFQSPIMKRTSSLGACSKWWRRQWHPTLVLLPGKSHGWRSLVGCSPWGCCKSNTNERLHFHFHFSLSCIGEGNGNPLQCSCLENPRDGVAQSWTRLKRLSSSSSSSILYHHYDTIVVDTWYCVSVKTQIYSTKKY